MLFLAIGIILLASVVIMFACDGFDDASSHLGRNMPPGVKGATINAIASSLPELFTTGFLLFLYHDHDGFSAGIATCAGSAVFNAVIIPGLCILAVMFVGVRRRDGSVEKVQFIEVSRNTILRDGFFFLLAELVLIWFLGGTTMAWWMGGGLMAVYGIYFGYLWREWQSGKTEDEDEDEDEDAKDDETSTLRALLTFDFNALLFGGAALNDRSAWVVLTLTTAVIGAACGALSWAVMATAEALEVAPYFTAVILAAAATSVPDTVISVKDAMRGDYDDAVANAIGSNIFDITVALGLPLFLYGLIYGDVSLAASGSNAAVQELRIALIFVSVLVLGIFLFGTRVGRGKAVMLFSLYVLWTTFILGRAMEWVWLSNLVGS